MRRLLKPVRSFLLARAITVSLVAASGLLAGCPSGKSGAAAVVPPRPVADISSPEKAMKSYWASLDWMRARKEAAGAADAVAPTFAEVMADVSTGSVLSSFSKETVRLVRLERSLESVDLAGGDKAVAHARIRNASAGTTALTPTPIEIDPESAGLYRFVLSRELTGWKIAEVWRVDDPAAARRIR